MACKWLGRNRGRGQVSQVAETACRLATRQAGYPAGRSPSGWCACMRAHVLDGGCRGWVSECCDITYSQAHCVCECESNVEALGITLTLTHTHIY